MPIDLSSNKFPSNLNQNSTFMCLRLPTNVEGIIPRLWHMKSTINYLKSSSNYLLIYFLNQFLFKILPSRLAFSLLRHIINKNTCVINNLLNF